MLVLASYERILWTVKDAGNAKVAAVLLSGQHESGVVGLDNTKTLKIGGGHTYKPDSVKYKRLKTAASPNLPNPASRLRGDMKDSFSDLPKNTGASSF